MSLNFARRGVCCLLIPGDTRSLSYSAPTVQKIAENRILGDRPFAEVGEPALAVGDERGRVFGSGGHA
ncbi:hypothetical protein [Streptomyces sp. ME18-1-4]|uniref:hypothetical protein n=1 Tax=Streptomyces sp. ME18-1-4 TaxID=3028685 RepID=UPI0029B3ACF6|nr:hypothetical protein [Streptomyces sp. ME18-1-4]MDX3248555.1 hypothetical protein [Streptomyces sp. ME18-1-4]